MTEPRTKQVLHRLYLHAPSNLFDMINELAAAAFQDGHDQARQVCEERIIELFMEKELLKSRLKPWWRRWWG